MVLGFKDSIVKITPSLSPLMIWAKEAAVFLILSLGSLKSGSFMYPNYRE